MIGTIIMILVCAGAFGLEYVLNRLVERITAELEDTRRKIDRAVDICIKREHWEEAVDLIGSISKWKFRFMGGHKLVAHAVVQPFTKTLVLEAAFFANVERDLVKAGEVLRFAEKCQIICKAIPYQSHCCGGAARVTH